MIFLVMEEIYVNAYEIHFSQKLLTVSNNSILPKGRSLTANSGIKITVWFKGRSSTANSETQNTVLLGMDRFGSIPLLFPPCERSEKIPGAPTWK